MEKAPTYFRGKGEEDRAPSTRYTADKRSAGSMNRL